MRFSRRRAALYRLGQWTWGLPQTLLGALLYLLYMVQGRECFAFRGARVCVWPLETGLSLGGFLFLAPRAPRRLLLHEYGHSVQSLLLGPLYLLLVGLPSLLWCNLPCFVHRRARLGLSYYAVYPEAWADRLGVWATGEALEESCPWTDRGGAGTAG